MFSISLVVTGAFLIVLAIAASLRYNALLYWIPFLNCFLPIQYINRYFFEIPNVLVWFVYFVPLLFAALTIIVDGVPKNLTKNLGGALYFLAAYELISMASLFLNELNPLMLLASERGVFQIFSWVVIIHFFLKKNSIRTIYSSLAYASVVVVVIGIFQRLLFVNLFALGSADMVTGGFVSDKVYLLCILVSLVFILSGLIAYTKVVKMNNLWLIFILLLGLAFGNNKASFGFVVMLLLIIVATSGVRQTITRSFRLVSLSIMLVTGLFLFDYFLSSSYSAELGQFRYFEIETVQNYFFGDESDDSKFAKGGELRRGAATEFAIATISSEYHTLFFGRGPNSASDSKLSSAKGGLAQQYDSYEINRTDLSTLIAEKGILGTLLYILFILSMALPISRKNVFSIARSSIAILFLLYLPYESVMSIPYYTLVVGMIIHSKAEIETVVEKSTKPFSRIDSIR